MKECILSIDSSSSSVDACVVDVENFCILKRFSEKITVYNPAPGLFEFDAEEIWNKQESVLLQAKNWAQDWKIIGIGISNQRETIVAWSNKTKKPICRAISWQDSRNPAFVKMFDEHKKLIKHNTGLDLNEYFSASKIFWILENIDLDRKDVKFGTIDSWLIWNLTGGKIHFTDVTNASRTMCMNLSTQKWDEKILSLFNIPIESLPVIRPSGSCFGFWNDIPILGVIGDQQAALLTLGRKFGAIQCTYGTGLFVLQNSGDFIFSFPGSASTVAWQIEGCNPVYAVENGILSCGTLLEKLQNQGYLHNYEADKNIFHEYIYLEAISNRLFIFNEGFISPDVRSFQISKMTPHNYVLKACLNGFSLAVKEIVNCFEKNVKAAPIVQLGGKISSIEYLSKIQSLVLERPVVVFEGEDASALGAFFLVLLSIKKITWRDIDAINKAKKHVFFPERMYVSELIFLNNLWTQSKYYL